MQTKLSQAMYGYIFQPLAKAGKTGEGSRGGKIVGHTKSGKPIYDSEGHERHKDFDPTEKQEVQNLHHELRTGRKPYPGEDSHKVEEILTQQQRKKTFMPLEGTSPHYTDTPNLRAYKNVMKYFKQKGLDFMGHITYDPKTDMIYTLSDVGKSNVENILAEHSAKHSANQSKRA
jgi:hypothetical protein